MPLPRIDQALETLSGNDMFSALDALHGFWQVCMAESAKKYLAFSTHRGTFLWNRMPMGPRTAPATY